MFRLIFANKFKEIILAGGAVSDLSNGDKIIDSGRKPIVLSGDGKTEGNSYMEHISKNEESSKLAFLSGTLGGFVSSCLSNGMPCKVLLIQTLSGIADPEGVSILIEWLNKNLDSSFKVGVAPLKEKAKEIKLRLQETVKSIENAKETEKERIYR